MHMEGLEQNRRGRELLRCNIHIYLQVYLSIRVVFSPAGHQGAAAVHGLLPEQCCRTGCML